MNRVNEINELDALRAMIRTLNESLDLSRAVLEHRAMLLRKTAK